MSSADQREAIGMYWLQTWQRQYGFALVVTAVACVLRYGLDAVVGVAAPYAFFYPAIMIIALLGGFGPGAFSTLLSSLMAGYLFLKPVHSLPTGSRHDAVGLAIFATMGATMSWGGNVFRTRAKRLQECEKAIEGLDEMILVVDRSYRYVIANRAFLNYRQLRRQDLIGSTVDEVLPPAQFEVVKKNLDECFTGKIVQFEAQTTYPKMGKRDLFISYFPIEGPGGVTRVACVLQDITEKNRALAAQVLAEEALRASEERLRLAQEIAQIGTYDRNFLTGESRWTPEMEQMYGLEPGTFPRTVDRFIESIHPDDRERVSGLVKRSIELGEAKGEWRVIWPDGSVRWIAGRWHVFKDGQGTPVRAIGIDYDITDRKQTENALRESEARLRLVVEHAPAAVAVFDREMCYLQASKRWRDDYGLGNRDLLGISHYAVFPEIPDRWKQMHRRALAGETLSETADCFVRADGTEQWLRWEIRPWYEAEDRIGGIAIFTEDITDCKLAEGALQKSEERFRVALKDSPVTVFNQDLELRYTWIYNPQLYWQHDAIGKTDAEVIGGRNAASLVELKRRVLKTGAAQRQELVISNDGKSFALDFTIEPLFDAEGKMAGITGAAIDVARLRELADSLQDAKDKLVLEKSYLESEIQTELGFEEVIGRSPALREVLKNVRIVAPTDSTVLLLGETGTGKELVARSLHALSARRDKTFIKLNCAAVPSGLLESELFGHEKGAFTSAVSQKVGRIELADGGTLFLDEIGELPIELQPKLLRVLQDREFERLGGVKTLHVDVRIVSATNRDLMDDIANNRFREDLYYRLHVFPISLPSLRERRDDIPILVQHFVNKHSKRMGKHIDIIPKETMNILRNWSWPGNIRELENMIERMVILSKGSVLAQPPLELDVPDALAEGKLTEDSLTAMEREHIVRVLRETHGVLSGTDGAAKRLGMKRTTLQSMLKRFGIQLQDFRRGNGTYGSA